MSSRSEQSQVGNRYGSEDSTIAGALAITRAVIRDCQEAMAVLDAKKAPKEGHDNLTCECPATLPGGTTAEDALEVDEEVELDLAFSVDNSCGSVFNPTTAAAE